MTKSVDEIDELRERVRQLKDMLAPPKILFPRVLELSHNEEQVLRYLFTAPGGYRSWDHLASFIQDLSLKNELQDARHDAAAHLVTLRKKMRPVKIDLITRYKAGIFISVEHRRRLAAMIRETINDFDWEKELAA